MKKYLKVTSKTQAKSNICAKCNVLVKKKFLLSLVFAALLFGCVQQPAGVLLKEFSEENAQGDGERYFYKVVGGDVAVSGSVSKPTPCSKLEASVVENEDESVTLKLSVSKSSEVCVQVIQPVSFNATIGNAAGKSVSVEYNGRNIQEA